MESPLCSGIRKGRKGRKERKRRGKKDERCGGLDEKGLVLLGKRGGEEEGGLPPQLLPPPHPPPMQASPRPTINNEYMRRTLCDEHMAGT